MFIELLVVGAILMYLYGSGFLSFQNPFSIFISLGFVTVAISAGWAFTHFIARSFVDNLFGVSSWSPRKSGGLRKFDIDGTMEQIGAGAGLSGLQKLARELPKDFEVSRRLSEEYLRLGMKTEYVHEKLRIIEEGKLTREQECTTLNRIADIHLGEGDPEAAVACLEKIVEKHRNTVEADNAVRRCAVIRSTLPLKDPERLRS